MGDVRAASADGLDVITIRDLHLRCIVGIFEEERERRQDVVLNPHQILSRLEILEHADADTTGDGRPQRSGLFKQFKFFNRFIEYIRQDLPPKGAPGPAPDHPDRGYGHVLR